MYDDFTLEHKCRSEVCAGFAEFSLFETGLQGRLIHKGDVCEACLNTAGGCVTSSEIIRGLGEWWEIAEQMGWTNPIDTLFNKHGVDNPEDLPPEEQARYDSAVDEAEADAIEYIQKHFPDYITKKVIVRFGEGADEDCHVETYKFFSDAEVDAFRLGLCDAVGWQSYDIVYPDGELDKLRKESAGGGG